jgi:hypothetical protein
MPNFKIVNNISDINLSKNWTDSPKFNSKDRIVLKNGKLAGSHNGTQYQILSKKERNFSNNERIGRICLGIIATIFSLGLALIAKSSRNLFNKKETIRFGVLTTVNPNCQTQSNPSSNNPPAVNNKNNPFPAPQRLVNRVGNIEVSTDKITTGQGEYVVFHKMPNGEKKELSRETFEKAYTILNSHSPLAIMNSGVENAAEKCANRYQLIKAQIKDLDPTLEAIFVPRTLYELIFIRKCIQEDMKNEKNCIYLDSNNHALNLDFFKGNQQKFGEFSRDKENQQAKRKCWHLCHFSNEGDNEHPKLKDVVFRMNKVIIKALNLPAEGFTHQEYQSFVDKEIQFLNNHYKQGVGAERVKGPTTNFGVDKNTTSMCIRNKADAKIIQDAVTLECSKAAQHALFLFRGANFNKDSVISWTDRQISYSLSYGSSLFAGCLFDGGATAFYYMRKEKNAYALPVSFEQVTSSPFYVPRTNTAVQLFGDGETFHARTKAWKDYDLQHIEGINFGDNFMERDHLKSELSQAELISQFEHYKKNAVQLK